MTSIKIHLAIVSSALFILSGCYTSFKTVTPEESVEVEGISQVTHLEDGWYELNGAYYYIDYATRQWYNSYGINLGTERSIQKMVAHGYHPPSSSYFYSPVLMRAASSGNLPIYNSKYIVPGVYHPPYYSNPYLYSFFYNKWAQWYYWDSERPNSWCYNPYQLSAFYGSSLSCDGTTSTSLAHANYNNNNKVLRDRVDLNPDFIRSVSNRVGENPDLNVGERDRVLARKFDENGVRALRSRTEILRSRIDNVRVEQVETGIRREDQMIRWAVEYHERNRYRSTRSTYSNYNRNSSRNNGISSDSGINRTRAVSSESSGSASGRSRNGSSTTRENNN